MSKSVFRFSETATPANRCEIPDKIMALFGSPLKELLLNVPPELQHTLEEIRLRVGRPVMLRTHNREWQMGAQGPTHDAANAYICQPRDVQVLINQAGGGSLYSMEEELRGGFVTLPGGHRLGFSGQAVMDRGQLKTITHISGVNVRLAREVIGCAGNLIAFLVDKATAAPLNVLIISPPQCGKTTLLRDIIRYFSSGPKGVQVGVVDERSEIAGCFRGVPQLDLGERVDVLDRCPKAQGMVMMVRAMSPQAVAADEIGREEDVRAILEMRNAGVKVITTVHGNDLAEVTARPQVEPLIRQGIFDRYVVLSRSRGVGTVQQVLDGQRRLLNSSPLSPGGGG